MELNMMDAAQVFGFATQASRVINTRVYEIEYPEMDIASLVTVDTSLPEWVSGIDTLVGDKTGKAEWQSGAAKDIPLAGVDLSKVGIDFDMYAIGYQWNVEELGKAQYQGYPLTERKAAAARFGSQVFLWDNLLVGSDAKGWKGLLNSDYVTPVTLPADGTDDTSAWVTGTPEAPVGNKTAAQIVRDVNILLLGAPGPGRIVKDTLLLPDMALDYIVATPYGVTSPNLSIMQYIMANNEYTRRTGQQLTVRSLDELKDKATVNIEGGGRAVAYRNDADLLKLWVPLPYRFLPIYQDGPLNFTVPGIARTGPLDIMRPNAISYGDAVTPVPA
ncbi:MAG: major capsid family protein [Pseudomonadota bacterium]|nr:major capsid family protein [Pseudomonadota bacterium]